MCTLYKYMRCRFLLCFSSASSVCPHYFSWGCPLLSLVDRNQSSPLAFNIMIGPIAHHIDLQQSVTKQSENGPNLVTQIGRSCFSINVPKY